MSFVLPGNARSLRFTGEAKAVPKTEAPGAAILGKPRERKTAPSPLPPPPARGRPVAPREISQREIYADPGAGPYGGGPIVRHKLESLNDDGDPTMALDREGHDVLPGGLRPRTQPAPMQTALTNGQLTGPVRPREHLPPNRLPQNHLPPPRRGGQASLRAPRVPHFPDPIVVEPDPTNDPPTLARHTTGSQRVAPLGAPYAIWIVAAVLAGILSYHVAPALMARLEAPRPTPIEAP